MESTTLIKRLITLLLLLTIASVAHGLIDLPQEIVTAARRGDLHARYRVAIALAFRDNPSQEEYKEGIEWLISAAEGGYRPAMTRYARLLDSGGLFFKKDKSAALPWLIKCADAGEPYCMRRTGWMLGMGEVGAVDLSEGYKWHILAYTRTLPRFSSAINADMKYMRGRMTDADERRAREKVAAWLPAGGTKDPEPNHEVMTITKLIKEGKTEILPLKGAVITSMEKKNGWLLVSYDYEGKEKVPIILAADDSDNPDKEMIFTYTYGDAGFSVAPGKDRRLLWLRDKEFYRSTNFKRFTLYLATSTLSREELMGKAEVEEDNTPPWSEKVLSERQYADLIREREDKIASLKRELTKLSIATKKLWEGDIPTSKITPALLEENNHLTEELATPLNKIVVAYNERCGNKRLSRAEAATCKGWSAKIKESMEQVKRGKGIYDKIRKERDTIKDLRSEARFLGY